MILRWAFRELAHSRAKLIGVFFILIVGFLGPLFSSALNSSVEDYLSYKARQLLAADLAVTLQREFKPDEVKKASEISKATRVSQVTEFSTMARGKETSALIEVQAVDSEFPILGQFELQDGSLISKAPELFEGKTAWVFSEVATQLGLEKGSEFNIGNLTVEVGAILKDAPGLSRAGGFNPKVFLDRKLVAETGLTEFGSQVAYRLYFKLPVGSMPVIEGSAIKDAIDDPDLYVRTPEESMNRLERFFTFFRVYLVSVSMIVFALSWVSAFYILQIYLQDRLRNAAVLLTFGASRVLTVLIAGLQIFILMVSSLAVSAVLIWIVVKVAPSFAGDKFPTGFVLRLAGSDLLKLAGVAAVSALAFLSPLAIRLIATPLQDLLHESSTGVGRLKTSRAVLAYSPLGVVFILLSFWLMDSWQNALALTGGLLGATLIGWGLARFVFKSLFVSLKHTPGLPRLVITNLSRSRFGVNLCFISILIGTLVLNLVPHLMASAVSEIEPLQGKEIPALFLFNIPESKVADLKLLAERESFELRYLAPMILGRLQTVNDKNTEDDQFQRFPVRLSYRNDLIGSETLLKGQMPKGHYQASEQDPEKNLPEISVEKDFADRNGFKIGDKLTYDIQGLPVSGRITSIRSVRWTDFNPNFFMIFQNGVLDDAPKTYLASVNLALQGPEREKKKGQLQYEMAKLFPDMSILDVGRTIGRVLEVARSVLGPVKAAAAIAVTMSFLVLLGVIVHNLRKRENEIDIQKILGADADFIRRLMVSEYLVLATCASVIGSLFAIGITAIVSLKILEIPMKIDVSALLVSVIVTILLTGLIAYISSSRVLKLRGATRKL